MTIKERLLAFLKAEKVNHSEFARLMGLSPAYLGSMRKSMPEEKIERLCEVFPTLNRDWLLYGRGDMHLPARGAKLREEGKWVPLIPFSASAGNIGAISDGVNGDDCKDVYSIWNDADMAIEVAGDSMEPKVPSGTRLFIARINHASFIPWGNIMVVDTENGAMVKMLFPSEKGEEYVEARSCNPAYPPFQIPTDSIYGIYRILGQVRKDSLF